MNKRRQHGFSLVTAVFLITVLAVFGTFLLVLSGVSHQTPVLGLNGAQAYHAARSGLEWGIAGAINTDDPVNCNGTLTLGDYTVVVTCDPPTLHDGANIYRITSTATLTGAVPGDLVYARRQLRAVVSPSPPN